MNAKQINKKNFEVDKGHSEPFTENKTTIPCRS